MSRHFSFEAFKDELEALKDPEIVSKLFYAKFNLAVIDQVERDGTHAQERIDERRKHWARGMECIEAEIKSRNMDLGKAQAWAPKPIVPTDKDVVVKMKPIYLTGEFKG